MSHTTRCNWNAFACAAENVRDYGYEIGMGDDLLSLKYLASDYQATGVVFCDAACHADTRLAPATAQSENTRITGSCTTEHGFVPDNFRVLQHYHANLSSYGYSNGYAMSKQFQSLAESVTYASTYFDTVNDELGLPTSRFDSVEVIYLGNILAVYRMANAETAR